MHAVRLLVAQRHLAVLICVSALLLKLLVPTGYMIADDHGRIAIAICPGAGPTTMAVQMPAMHGAMPDHGKSKDHGKAEMPCAFAGLSIAALEAIDPVQLAGLVAYVLASGLVVAILPVLSRLAYLRPPLRGPPSYL